LFKGIENLRKTLTHRYEYKPIPKKLSYPLYWLLLIVAFAGLWSLEKASGLELVSLFLAASEPLL
jgi:hypothetical protein